MSLAQLPLGLGPSIMLLLSLQKATVDSLHKKTSSQHSKPTPAGQCAGSNQLFKPTLTALLLCFFCLTMTASAEITNPQCSRNVCTLPANECVYTCPRFQRGVYFQFGLRSNKKCAPPTNPGGGDLALQIGESETSTDLALIEALGLDDADSNKTSDLAKRQDLWPEYGPPDCFWALCQFKGPACILWCTEDKVYYGSDDMCKDAGAAQSSAAMSAGHPWTSATLTFFAAVLLSMMGLSQDIAMSVQR
jgi:hypothetical protein